MTNQNMFKVSFTDKKVERFNDGKATVVTLKGNIKLPEQVVFLPKSILSWIARYIGNSHSLKCNGMSLQSVGKAVCSDSDACDPIVGERIAEARAKVSLYRFMFLLCKRVFNYYYAFLNGGVDVTISIMNDNDSLYNAILKYQALHERECEHLNTLLYDQFNGQGTPQP